jgi:hypothetical protein
VYILFLPLGDEASEAYAYACMTRHWVVGKGAGRMDNLPLDLIGVSGVVG